MIARRHPSRPAQLVLWITDPWTSLDHPADTTLRLAEAMHELGVTQAWADAASIELEHRARRTRTTVLAYSLRRPTSLRTQRTGVRVARGSPRRVDVARFDQVHFRVDPPVDASYESALRLLELGCRAHALINPPSVTLGLGEKLAPLSHPLASPDTYVGQDLDGLVRFAQRYPRVVVKPLASAQSRGVEMLATRPTRELRRRLARALQAQHLGSDRRPWLLIQPDAATRGPRRELRSWWVDGKLLALAEKRPRAGDTVFVLERGARVSALTQAPSARLRASLTRVGGILRRDGVRLAAIDWVGDQIIDWNVTSPGLIVEMEQALGRELAPQIAQSLLRRRRRA